MFVADFIGSPPMNFLRCDAGLAADACAVTLKDVRVPIPELRQARPAGPLVLGVRPEHIRFADGSGGALHDHSVVCAAAARIDDDALA